MTKEVEQKERMSVDKAAEYLGMSPHTLRAWRNGRPLNAPKIPYYQATPRGPVTYDKADLDAFLTKSKKGEDSE